MEGLLFLSALPHNRSGSVCLRRGCSLGCEIRTIWQHSLPPSPPSGRSPLPFQHVLSILSHVPHAPLIENILLMHTLLKFTTPTSSTSPTSLPLPISKPGRQVRRPRRIGPKVFRSLGYGHRQTASVCFCQFVNKLLPPHTLFPSLPPSLSLLPPPSL